MSLDDHYGFGYSSSCSPSKRRHKYDVFLSFRQEDTCKIFAERLCLALDMCGLITFKDYEELGKGQDIKPSLNLAIQESLSAIVVFSEKYASSRWCLDELQRILHFKKELGFPIFPIYYEVEPSDVQHQNGSFGKAFEKLAQKFADDEMKVQTWRDALKEVTYFVGWPHTCYRDEVELIQIVVETVRSKLHDYRLWLDSNDKGCSKGCLLPAIDLVGDKFQTHTQQIWEWIMKNEVSAIGIWGMGGAGKTALATHVHNKLLEEKNDDFSCIIWVTVSQYDDSICELQKAIARSINLDIYDECDVKRISGKLLQASKHINKCVLILDDIWDPIYLDEVGFPISNNGSKLILTTRSWQVCQSMNCMKNIIKVEPLDEEEGWDLFKKTLGIHQIQSNGLERIARAVTKQFGGLPLAIVTVARIMERKEDIREWNHLLECLQNLDYELYHMDERVFPVLKSSYACLNNQLQSFFLYYALSVEEDVDDSYVQPLIKRFFYEGWTHKTKSFEIHLEDGYTMLHELKNNSLLIEKKGRRRMHTLLRVMAISIAKKTDEIMAKPGMNLIDIPENGEWKENLHKVFLTKSNIQKILDGTSPKCAKLSTLLLDCNYDLKWIPDEFFSNMPALKILDLSRTGVGHLPESISNLECLIALFLSGCEELSYMPSLAKLQQLIELDLSFTAITEAPCGLELLVNIKCLNLEGTDQLKMSSSTVSKMTHLQSLRLMNWIPKSMDVSVQDLQGLIELKVISVNFCDIEEFNAYVNGFLDKDHVLKSYCLSLAMSFDPDSFVSALESRALKRVVLCGIVLANRTVVLPEDINELIISKCHHWTRTTCVGNALSFRTDYSDFPKIEWLQVTECDKLEYLCCVSPTCVFCSSVQLVRRLSLIALKDLKQIVAPIAPFLDSPFLYLRDLQICKCSKMKILIMPELLSQIQNLETISVESCESMEEIVGENCCTRNTFSPTIILPKVRSVALHDLAELTFLFRGIMLCPALEYFKAYGCEKLKAPHIEKVEGYKLQMEMPIGYNWEGDNQVPEFDD